MKKFLLLSFSFLGMSLMAQEITEPLVIPQLYTWKLTPNGKWFAGGTREVCDYYNLDIGKIETYQGAKYGTITNDGVLAINGGKPSLLINGEVVIPPSLEGARSGSVQLISSSGNRLCGSINYPSAGINGMYVCDIDENGVVGAPQPVPRPTLDFFGCKPQFVNMQAISDDGSTITGFVQDWRGFYCYPIIFRENEDGKWEYSYPTETLFNPNNYPIPENPWLNEPKFPNFTDFMNPVEKMAYEDALANYYMGFLPELPDAKDYMTPEEWDSYYEAALYYNDWWYGQQDAIKAYENGYNKILNSSVIFDLNEVAISPDGNLIGCSYLEYPDGIEKVGVIKINTHEPLFQKYESLDEDLYTTQILNDGTMLMSQPMILSPNTYIILPDKMEMMNIKDYFEETHPDYLAWINEYLERTGTIYTNEDMTVFSGSVLPADCDRVEEVTGGYYAFTYIFSPEIAGVEEIPYTSDSLINVFSLQGYKILETKNLDDLKNLPKGIYVINGKLVQIK